MHSLIYTMFYMFLLTITYSIIIYNISSIKLSKKRIYIFTLINYSFSFFLARENYNSLVLVLMIISISIYTYIEYRKIYYSIIITALTIIIMALSDLITGSFEMIVFKINRIDIVNNPTLYLVTMIFILVIAFVASRLIKKVIEKYTDFNLYIKKHHKHMLILIAYLFVVVIFIVVFVNIYKDYSEIGGKIILLYSIFVIYSFIVIIALLRTSHKNIKNELEKEYKEKETIRFKEYTNELEILTNDLRKFRHDYMNILKTLGGYVELEDTKGLKNYYNDIVKESERALNKDNRCIMLLQYIKINPLKTLIASKVINAQSMGLNINIEITEDIEELSIKVIDICRIIGIFLDNAIEAALDTKEKTIEFAIIKDEEQIIFIIINSCSEDTPPIYKIYEKNFSTKGFNRGLGLKTVREIISERYSTNVISNTKVFNLKFMQELIINNVYDKNKF